MSSKEAPGDLENVVHRVDPMPMPGEGIQTFEGLGRRLRRKVAFSFETRDGRGALDGRTPPGDHPRLAEKEIPDRNRSLLLDQQRHQGRAVPELHRPSLRSASRAPRALAPADGRGGFAIRISRGSGAEPRRSSPWRSSRARRPSGSSPSPPDRFQAGYRTSPVEDEDRFAVLHLIDERAEVVLGIGQGGSLHLARIANFFFPFKRCEIAAARAALAKEVAPRSVLPPPPAGGSPGRNCSSAGPGG